MQKQLSTPVGRCKKSASIEEPPDDDGKAWFEQVVNGGAMKDQQLSENAAGLVTPVHHTIRIEAVK